MAENRAEAERCRNLSTTERLEEDGQTLLRDVERLNKAIVLQKAPRNDNSGARCGADEGCLSVHRMRQIFGEDTDLQHVRPDPRLIRDQYRIFIDKESLDKRCLYYHLECFEAMVDLKSLVPDKFSLDTSTVGGLPSWGLMLREWFEKKGNVALDEIAAYIDAEKAYHGVRCDLRDPATRPVLRDYITAEGGGCSLSDVVQHRYCHLMANTWTSRQGPSGVEWKMVFPEDEAQESDVGVPDDEGKKAAALT
jgi:hypothetical protein